MKTKIGISDANTQAVATELGKLLADENILYLKTKNAHWNIEGGDFYDKHKFFEIQINQLNDIIDAVAERMRTIGHYAPATMASYLSTCRLTEQGKDKNTSKEFIEQLLVDHESIIVTLRETIKLVANEHKDVGSSDFMTGLMENHEKMAWFLRAHLA